jgi:adenylate kinase
VAFYIVILGLPGAGKGTQAELVAKRLNIRHISTGAIFRENIKNKSELGKQVEEILARGDLVPDAVTNEIVRTGLHDPRSGKGVIFDGFPRTSGQAEALDTMLKEMDQMITCAPYIQVPENVLVKRLSGRWTCRQSGHIYHNEFNPPQEKGICDVDGSELYQREDDKRETVERRISVFMDQTEPLVSYYQQQEKLLKINGDQYIETVTDDLLQGIKGKSQ